uniref:calcium/calmodulin-dependent protein kinase n=1 Tax=Elaeophora elaphi TaxID=1147741 RepID=A0A0R3RJ06_9BILA
MDINRHNNWKRHLKSLRSGSVTPLPNDTHCSLRRWVLKQNFEEKYQQLNQYRLIREIGQGSYGIVKLAYNEEDKNLYALKVLDKMKLLKNFACFRRPPNRIRSRSSIPPDPMQAVQREIAILKKLNHPNIVKLVEVLNDPNNKYYCMVFELLENGPVLEIPTENPLDERVAWSYFRDTVKGLEYRKNFSFFSFQILSNFTIISILVHYQKIIHRDIKPSNLLLSETGHVKIADFGISYEFQGIDAFLSGTAGTPAFMAPEALTGLSIFGNVEFPNPFIGCMYCYRQNEISDDSSCFYSGRAQDIWSLGITLYAFVFGAVPFWDSYVIALHKKIKNDAIIFPNKPVISKPLELLILSLLKKDPSLRLMMNEIKEHQWTTQNGLYPMPSEAENCELITVTNEEIRNCVRNIPHLDTLILVKFMVHRRRFCNPFKVTEKNTSSLRKVASEGGSFLINRLNEKMISSIDLLNARTKNLLLDVGKTRNDNAGNIKDQSTGDWI